MKERTQTGLIATDHSYIRLCAQVSILIYAYRPKISIRSIPSAIEEIKEKDLYVYF